MTQEGLPHVLVFSLEKATGTTWALGRESRPLRFFNRGPWGNSQLQELT